MSFLNKVANFDRISNVKPDTVKTTEKNTLMVLKVAQEVIKELHADSHRVLDAKKEFTDLNKFIQVLQKFVDANESTPQGKELKHVLTTLKQDHEKIQRVASARISTLTTKSTVPIFQAVPSTETKQERMNRIREKIRNLSIANPHLNEEIRLIKADIDQLKSLDIKTENIPQLDALKNALDLLSSPTAYKASSTEFTFVQEIFHRDIPSGPDHDKQVVQQLERYSILEEQASSITRTGVLLELQQLNENNFITLIKGAPLIAKNSVEEACSLRLHAMNAQLASPLDLKFIEQAPAVIQTLEKYEQSIHTTSSTLNAPISLPIYWEQQLSKLPFSDIAAPDVLNELFSHYSWDPVKDFSLITQELRSEFIQKLIFTEKAPQQLREILEKNKERHLDLFKENLQEISSDIKWVVSNYHNLQIPYDQGLAKDTNLGEGVCFANSLERIAELSKDPEVIPQMGSSQSSRFRQNIYNSALQDTVEKSEQRLATAFKLKRIERVVVWTNKSYTNELARLGDLKKTAQSNLAKETDPNKKEVLFLEVKGCDGAIKELTSLKDTKKIRIASQSSQIALGVVKAAEKNKNVIFALRGSSDGHAINIQVDSEKRIFRLMDDNYGLFKFNSRDELIMAITEQLDWCYSEYVQFTIESYAEIT